MGRFLLYSGEYQAHEVTYKWGCVIGGIPGSSTKCGAMTYGGRRKRAIHGGRDRTQRWRAGAVSRSVLALLPIGLVSFGVLGFSGIASASGGPGSMKVSPAAIAAGTNPATLKFTYVAPAAATSGTLLLTVPTGWTAPQTTKAGSPGDVAIGSKTCSSAVLSGVSGSGPWVIKIKINCAAGKKLKISYRDVSVPTTAATDQFPASFKTGKTTTPLTASARNCRQSRSSKLSRTQRTFKRRTKAREPNSSILRSVHRDLHGGGLRPIRQRPRRRHLGHRLQYLARRGVRPGPVHRGLRRSPRGHRYVWIGI